MHPSVRGLRPVLTALFILVFGAASRAQSPSCPAGYQDSYRAQWELMREDWTKLCAQSGTTDDALREGQRVFLESCATKAQPSLDANLIRADEIAALCAQGVPGRAKIPRPAGASLAAGPGREPPQQTAAAQEDARRTADAKMGAATGRIGKALNGDVASLYGERTAADGRGAVTAAPLPDSPKTAPASPAPAPAAPVTKVPPPPYNPSDKAKAPYLVILDKRLMENGASPEAVAYIRTRYRDMLEHMEIDTLKNLVYNDQNLAVIPKDKKLTEVSPFTALKDQKTFDGRPWNDVRGVAGVPMGPGKRGTAAAIAEENLLMGGGGYPQGFTFFHEYGHAVKDNGLPPKTLPPSGWMEQVKRSVWGDPATQQHVKEIYDASMKRPEKTGLDDYANSNDDELYAQATAAFFGVGYPYLKKPKDTVLFTETPVTLYKANVDIFKVCVSVYGQPGRFWNKK